MSVAPFNLLSEEAAPIEQQKRNQYANRESVGIVRHMWLFVVDNLVN